MHIGRSIEYRQKEIESIIQRNVDAVIVFGEHGPLNKDLLKMAREGIKTVILGRTQLEECSCICQDDEKGAYDAMKYLINNGHTKIALISGFGTKEFISSIEETTIECGRQTVTGIMKAAKEMNVDFDLKRDTIGDCYRDYDYMKKKMLGRSHTAYICREAAFLTKFYEICSNHKISIPDDISVIGISGQEAFSAYNPVPTFFQHDYKEIARKSVEFIASDKIKTDTRVPFKFIEGKSVKKIK
jgi:LacI family transcriptional regulator